MDPTAQASRFPPHSPSTRSLGPHYPCRSSHRCAPLTQLRAAAFTGQGRRVPPTPPAPHRLLPSNLLPGRSPFRILLQSMRRRPPTIPAPSALSSSPATESTPHQVDGRPRGTGTPPPRLPSAPPPQLPSNPSPGRLPNDEDALLTPPPATVRAGRNGSCSGVVDIELHPMT
jgi:hypothetical protein